MLKTTEWWCDLNRTGRRRRRSPRKPMMSSTGGGRLDSQLYVFAAEDGVDTTWCKGAINSESEVARTWRLLDFGTGENIRDLQSSLENAGVSRDWGLCRQAGKQAGSCCCKGTTPGPARGQQSGLMGGVGRAASVELGVETKQTRKPGTRASKASTVQCKGEPHRSTRKRAPAATRIMRHEGAHCARKRDDIV